MKHLFVAHSYTTYLTAKLVIEHLKLKRQQTNFICTRNLLPFEEDIDISVCLPFQLNPQPFPTSRNLLKPWKKMYDLDRIINQIVGQENFYLYTFDFATRYNQMLMTHRKCIGINIVEEGMAAYYDKEFLMNLYKPSYRIREKILLFLGYFGRIREYAFIDKSCNHYYAISEFSFSGLDVKNVFNREVINSYLKKIKYHIPVNSVILVLDANVSCGDTTIEAYLESIKKSLEKFNNEKIFIKFHPGQPNQERALFLKEIEKLITNLNVVPDSVPLEKFVFDQYDYIFLGNISSILLYAGLMGKVAFSFNKLLDNENYKTRKIFNQHVSYLFDSPDIKIRTKPTAYQQKS